MDQVAGSHNDEWYTPEYAVTPLLEFLPRPPATIWCPFDTKQSRYVQVFEREGYDVAATHIVENGDFFELALIDPPKCDFIISNPPYSRKTEVLERLFAQDKPFAMLVGVVGLFENERRFNVFANNSFEMLYFNRRVSFMRTFDEAKPSLNPPFSSAYVCRGILPRARVFYRLQKK